MPTRADKAVPLHKYDVIADSCGDLRTVDRVSVQRIKTEYPFVSIFVATHNESLVIDRLLKSFAALSYPKDRFEIIIVDDSTDDTYQKIQAKLSDLQNLKVFRRENRTGWKGGALNIALDAMDRRTSLVLVLDADNILLVDTIEKFVSFFIEEQRSYREKGLSVLAIQGFPISKGKLDSDWEWGIKVDVGNWIARAIDFRLSQRNMIEFAAKHLLNLPIQITGSLFMIRADMIKSIKFSNDLCEDWELTLDVYCLPRYSHLLSSTRGVITSNNISEPIRNHPPESIFSKPVTVSLKPIIIFNQRLVSYCESPTDFVAYFRQRMRVSEGHTRGLRKKIKCITQSKTLSFVGRMELLLNGLQYAKFIFILCNGIIDTILIATFLLGINNYSQQLVNLFGISFILQAANLAIFVARITWASKICRPIRGYDIKDILSLLALYIVSTPAFVIGSLRGFLCNKGVFYRTPRNLPNESKLSRTSVPS